MAFRLGWEEQVEAIVMDGEDKIGEHLGLLRKTLIPLIARALMMTDFSSTSPCKFSKTTPPYGCRERRGTRCLTMAAPIRGDIKNW